MRPETAAIDRFLPHWDVVSRQSIVIHASPAIVYAEMRALDMSRAWVIRTLFTLRGLPKSAITLEALCSVGFAVLSEAPPDEIVLGLVGQFWTLSGRLLSTNAEAFLNFSEVSYAKAAWNFSVQDAGGGQVTLATETRVLCLDATSRKRFRRYWSVIRPFSGWIRTEALRLIKVSAEGAVSAR